MLAFAAVALKMKALGQLAPLALPEKIKNGDDVFFIEVSMTISHVLALNILLLAPMVLT